MDVAGDKENKVYESAYKKDVPLYERDGAGFVVGFGGEQRFFLHDGRERRARAQRDSVVQKRSARYFAPAAVDLSRDLTAKYLFFGRGTAAAAAAVSGSAMTGSAAEESFIRLEDESSPLEADESSAEVGETREQHLQKQTKEFNERLRANPKDGALWLAYIRFQDEVFRTSGMYTHKATAIVVEKKLSIFEQALKENPSDENLLAAYLELSREILDPVCLCECV